MTAQRFFRSLPHRCAQGAAVFLRDVGHGLLEVSHNSLALVGLTVVAVVAFTGGRADLRASAEQLAYNWLEARHEAVVAATAQQKGDTLTTVAEPDAVARATAADPHDLPRQQAAVAEWIARRYRVAPEPISRLVQEAWSVGDRAKLDPTLILSIMAIESSFNPFAQSSVGAQGLMQVMTQVHDAKYEVFGGKRAAFDPVTNLRVGAQVLKDCIQRSGSLDAGLRAYLGATAGEDDGGYVAKVLAEQTHLKQVAGGMHVPVTVGLPVAVHPAPEAEPTPDATAGPKEASVRADEQVAVLR